MKSYSVSVSVAIGCPAAEVHALLNDLPAHEHWTDHYLTDWQLLSDDPCGVGAKVRLRARNAAASEPAEVEIVESTPTLIVEEGRGGSDLKRRTRATYELRSVGDQRTVVTFTAELLEPATPLEGLAAPFTEAYLRRQSARAMERLRALLESKVVA
jgi:polyketide cyclase/dehydrase/lipid transport protein